MGEKETGASDEAERLKTKTKSNQSNDVVREDEARSWSVDTTPPDTSAIDDSAGVGDPAEAAINNSHSNIKNLREAGGAASGDPAEGAVNTSHSNIKNLREDGGVAQDDDWEHQSSKLAPERPGKSELAIGDPGVNGNIAEEPPGIAIGEPGVNNNLSGGPSGIAVTDEGVPAAKPERKSL